MNVMMSAIGVLQFILLINKITAQSVASDTRICRDSWSQAMPEDHFRRYACAKCFVQLFFNAKPLQMQLFPEVAPYLLYNVTNRNITYEPEAEMGRGACTVLEPDECARWGECCESARRCCARSPAVAVTDNNQTDTPSCPATWDGVGCWDATLPGVTAVQPCPSYYTARQALWRSPEVTRRCTEGGGWETHPEYPLEVSNYSQCYDVQASMRVLRLALYIDFIGTSISVVCLIIAIGIVTGYRSLRRELVKRQGVQLQFTLFVCVLASSGLSIIVHILFYDALFHDNPIYLRNEPWCVIVQVLYKYFHSATYMSMLCEGVFLIRRICNVMKLGLKDGLRKYMIITWVVPFIIVGTYTLARIFTGKTESCWIDEGLSNLEYIHLLPSIFSLLCNLGLLIGIEMLICIKMRSDTTDRRIDVARHAVRATLTLVPVFGVQFLFIIYRPRDWPPYEVIRALFTSTQGIFVSFIFCFMTNDVRSEVKASFRRCCGRFRSHGNMKRQVSTLSNTSTRSSRLSGSGRSFSYDAPSSAPHLRDDDLCNNNNNTTTGLLRIVGVQRGTLHGSLLVVGVQKGTPRGSRLVNRALFQDGVYLETVRLPLPGVHVARRASTTSKLTVVSEVDLESGSSNSSSTASRMSAVSRERPRLCENDEDEEESLLVNCSGTDQSIEGGLNLL